MVAPGLIMLAHQFLFQGIFLGKNIWLRRKLGRRIRGRNREATLSILFIALFIVVSLVLSLFDEFPGTLHLLSRKGSLIVALVLLLMNLVVGAASLWELGDSWRVGVLEDQKTELIEGGIYRISRNPYFLAYILMFAAYTILLQSIILLLLSVIGCAMIHMMVLKEEGYLTALHGERYRAYQRKVPRYLII